MALETRFWGIRTLFGCRRGLCVLFVGRLRLIWKLKPLSFQTVQRLRFPTFCRSVYAWNEGVKIKLFINTAVVTVTVIAFLSIYLR